MPADTTGPLPYGFEATTGTELWRSIIGATVISSLTVVNGMVYHGADNGNLYAYGLPAA